MVSLFMLFLSSQSFANGPEIKAGSGSVKVCEISEALMTEAQKQVIRAIKQRAGCPQEE